MQGNEVLQLGDVHRHTGVLPGHRLTISIMHQLLKLQKGVHLWGNNIRRGGGRKEEAQEGNGDDDIGRNGDGDID